MKSICRRCAFAAIVVFAAALSGNCRSELADSLYRAGFYDEAVTEYYRLIFFSGDSAAASEAHSKIGICYARMNRPGKALRHFDRAIALAQDDSMEIERRLDRTAALIAFGRIDSAAAEIGKIERVAHRPNQRTRAAGLKLLAEISAGTWAAASDSWRKYVELSGVESNVLDSLLAAAGRSENRSPSLAAALSVILPGLGQAYCGEWLKALNALALNGAVGYLTTSLLIDENYAGGSLSLLFLLQRYYLGNVYQAEKSAQQAGNRNSDRWRKIILEEFRSAVGESNGR